MLDEIYFFLAVSENNWLRQKLEHLLSVSFDFIIAAYVFKSFHYKLQYTLSDNSESDNCDNDEWVNIYQVQL